MRKLLIFAVVILGVFFLSTCENAISLIDEIETEVKIANDKFLVIKSVSPADLGSNINPGSEITVVFDRSLNLSSVTPSNFSVYNETDASEISFQNATFNSTTHTLTALPTGNFFDFEENYTLRISGFKGMDGSGLQSDYIWSFKTGIAPAGSIVAVDSDGVAEAGFTSGAIVNVSVDTSNFYAQQYFVSGTLSDFSNPGAIVGWQNLGTDFAGVTIADVEGIAPVYCMFTGPIPSGTGYSKIEKYDIMLDKSTPVVNAGIDRASNTTITQTGSVTEANVLSYSWSGGGLTFGSSSSNSTTISADTDGARTVTLTVTDKAGNTGNDSFIFTKDTIAPDPTATAAVTSSPTTDTTPTFSWTGDAVGGSGNYYIRYYAYSYANGTGTWTNSPGYTTLTSYSPSIAVSGIDRVVVTLWAMERDEAYNWSAQNWDDQIIVSNYLPYNTQNDVSTKVTFDWPSSKGIFPLPTYSIQFYEYDLKLGWRWIDKVSGLNSSFYKAPVGLLTSGDYTWRVGATVSRTTTYSSSLTFTIP